MITFDLLAAVNCSGELNSGDLLTETINTLCMSGAPRTVLADRTVCSPRSCGVDIEKRSGYDCLRRLLPLDGILRRTMIVNKAAA